MSIVIETLEKERERIDDASDKMSDLMSLEIAINNIRKLDEAIKREKAIEGLTRARIATWWEKQQKIKMYPYTNTLSDLIAFSEDVLHITMKEG